MDEALKVLNSSPVAALIGNIFRQALMLGGSALVTHGALDADTLNHVVDDLQTIGGAVVLIVTAVWSFRSKQKDVQTKQVLAQQVVAQDPATAAVVQSQGNTR